MRHRHRRGSAGEELIVVVLVVAFLWFVVGSSPSCKEGKLKNHVQGATEVSAIEVTEAEFTKATSGNESSGLDLDFDIALRTLSGGAKLKSKKIKVKGSLACSTVKEATIVSVGEKTYSLPLAHSCDTPTGWVTYDVAAKRVVEFQPD